MNIILFGFPGCGKTTIGQKLATRLSFQFIDLDRVIEDLYFTQQHHRYSVREIYRMLGEAAFRTLEQEALLSLTNIKNTIIATGGGAILDQNNRHVLEQLGVLVYLKASQKTIRERMMKNGVPAFLNAQHLESSFEKMYQARKKIYDNVAAIVIHTDGLVQSAILNKIIAEVFDGE
jgi:shikimate kinase